MTLRGDISNDIFEYNPELLLIDSIVQFKDHKKDASLFLWAIFYLKSCQSMLSNMGEDKRREYVEKNIYARALNESQYQQVVDDFLELVMTPAEKNLLYWRKQLIDLDKFTDTWSCKNIRDRVLVLEKRDKLWASLEQAEKKFIKEQSESRFKNNVVQSSAEEGSLFDTWGKQ